VTTAVYYVPNVPSNGSVTEYNHALALGEEATNARLITYPEAPPSEVADPYDTVSVLSSSVPLIRANRAAGMAERFDSRHRGETVFVTTFHYAPAFAGIRAKLPWVVDVYDDPYQYVYNEPRSIHRLTGPALARMLGRADRGIYTAHPSTPHVFHENARFAVNGAPTDVLSPRDRAHERVRGVVAGTKIGLETHVQAVAETGVPFHLDVFGDVSESERRCTGQLATNQSVTFHGYCAPEVVQSHVEASDVGFCLLTDRPDWQYAYPIRIGEYLAGGTVPIASDFPGIRDLVRNAGLLVDPRPGAIADAVRPVLADRDSLVRARERARTRATRIPWREERTWFARQAIECPPESD